MNIYAYRYDKDGKGKIHNKMPNLCFGFHYLCGKLEDLNGCDLFCIRRKDEDKLSKKRKGCERVTVIFPNGDKADADFYFWKPKYQVFIKGLVVLPDDRDAVEYATDCYYAEETDI